jgi:hypothetical protein
MVRQRTLLATEVSAVVRAVMINSAKALLDGVGQMPSSVELYHLAIHYRRALTTEEYSNLPPAWCAIPAVHEAGRGLILEENT